MVLGECQLYFDGYGPDGGFILLEQCISTTKSITELKTVHYCTLVDWLEGIHEWHSS